MEHSTNRENEIILQDEQSKKTINELFDVSFDEVTKRIVEFYAVYNTDFSLVDKLYTEIDDKGGFDDALLSEVLDILIKYHTEKCYLSVEIKTKLKPENRVDINKAFRNAANTEFTGSIKQLKEDVSKFQNDVHDYLTHDAEWSDQKQCLVDIAKYLYTLKKYKETASQDSQDDIYSAARILRELVADVSLVICGLLPIQETWNYGTKAFSQLSAEQQLTNILNQAIIIDRMYFSLHSLKTCLTILDKLLSGFCSLHWSVYYVAGLLNFKIHKYEQAKRYFKQIECFTELKESDKIEERNYFFRSVLLIAYSEEYSNNFGSALTKLICPPATFQAILVTFPFEKIEENYSEILDSLSQSAMQNSLFHHYFETKAEEGKLKRSILEQISDSRQKYNENSANEQYDIQKEILHALAHSLNEYSIKQDVSDQPVSSETYGKMLRLARKIMSELAAIDQAYCTCHATMYAEYGDYDHAIMKLKNARQAIKTKYEGVGKETHLAEISFFNYYFHQMANKLPEERADEDVFRKYCMKHSDDDAKCYLTIFEFRTSLRKYFSDFMSSVRKIAANESSDCCSLPPIPDELKKDYFELCNQQPTLYMNANVRAELRIMQRAYVCVERLYDYANKSSAVNLTKLHNSCERYWHSKDGLLRTTRVRRAKYSETEETRVKEEDAVLDSNLVVQNYENFRYANNTVSAYQSCSKNLDFVMWTLFDDKRGIMHCLHNSDSIFILAPISGVVVYQYQTGEIDKLYKTEDLFLTSINNGPPINSAQIRPLSLGYQDAHKKYGRYTITGLNWNKKPKQVKRIYAWKTNNGNSTKIVGASSNTDQYVHHIDSEILFNDIMERKLKECIDEKIACPESSEWCRFRVVSIGWLEFINEEEKEKQFYLYWRQNESGVLMVIVELVEEHLTNFRIVDDRHGIESWLRDIKLANDTLGLLSEPAEDKYQTATSVVLNNCEEIQKLRNTNTDIDCKSILADFLDKVNEKIRDEEVVKTNTGGPTQKDASKKIENYGEIREQVINSINNHNSKQQKELIRELWKNQLANDIIKDATFLRERMKRVANE
jgi:hypothetical protein